MASELVPVAETAKIEGSGGGSGDISTGVKGSGIGKNRGALTELVERLLSAMVAVCQN